MYEITRTVILTRLYHIQEQCHQRIVSAKPRQWKGLINSEFLINFAGNQCLAVTKQWLPNTNFDNPANWNKGRVPCAKDRVQLHGVRNEAIFITADKISAQHHTLLCIQFLDKESNGVNNRLPLGLRHCFRMVQVCT